VPLGVNQKRRLTRAIEGWRAPNHRFQGNKGIEALENINTGLEHKQPRSTMKDKEDREWLLMGSHLWTHRSSLLSFNNRRIPQSRAGSLVVISWCGNDMWLAKDNRFMNPMSTYEWNLMALSISFHCLFTSLGTMVSISVLHVWEFLYFKRKSSLSETSSKMQDS